MPSIQKLLFIMINSDTDSTFSTLNYKNFRTVNIFQSRLHPNLHFSSSKSTEVVPVLLLLSLSIFTNLFSVSIVESEKLNAGWVRIYASVNIV